MSKLCNNLYAGVLACQIRRSFISTTETGDSDENIYGRHSDERL